MVKKLKAGIKPEPLPENLAQTCVTSPRRAVQEACYIPDFR